MGILSTITGAAGLNPYGLIAGGVAVLALAGAIGYQNHEIHSWHTQYLTDEKTIGILQDRMAQATVEAKQRQATTTQTITEVLKVPGPTQTVIKTIHDAPIPKDCSTPAIDTLRNNT